VDDHEVLGVGPDASPDELAAAYRMLARRYHPDQHPGASTVEREIWAARMAEVNAAYARLTGASKPVRPPVPPPNRPATGQVAPATEPVAAARPVATPRPDLGWVFAVLGLAVVVVVLGVVVVVLLLASSNDPGGGPSTTAGPTPGAPPTLVVAEWAVGNCVAGGSVLVPVPCDQPNEGRIVRAVASPTDCPPEAEWWAEHALRVFCIDAG
jgi:DnaJ domain